MNATVLSLVLATVFAPPAKTSAERSTRIYVRTTPPGASIVLDGKELGTSDGLFLVPPGVRKITLEMDGYDPEAKTVDVKEGWITRVEVRMTRKGEKPGEGVSAAPWREMFYFDRTINDLDEGQGREVIDLDAGTLYDVPEEIQPLREVRIIHLPDADTKDTPVVLDLASGEMLKLPWKPEAEVAPNEKPEPDANYFTGLGKGDLGFDQELFCLRGGSVELWQDGSAATLETRSKIGDAKVYKLPRLPCELLVTTPEKRHYLVKVVGQTSGGGLDVEYGEHKGLPEKVTPQATSPDLEGFEPVRTLLIHDDSTRAACLVDLDTGELFDQPSGDATKGMSGEEWMASKGIDAGSETNAAAPGLWGMDMVVLPVSNEAWETARVATIESELRDGKPGSPAIMSSLGGLPRTFYFATREGGKGILQITAQTKDGQGEAFEVRYRLISQSLKLREAKAQMAAIELAMKAYQLDMGTRLSIEHGLEALLHRPDDLANPEYWKGPYLKTADGAIPVDPWGNEYRYGPSDRAKEFIGIVSNGPDGERNTPDDLGVWDTLPGQSHGT